MRCIMSIALALFVAVSALAQANGGIKPRAKAESYPAFNDQSSIRLGAAQLSDKQVRRSFVSGLGKNYIVVEVGAFPKSEVLLSPKDFVLHVRGESADILPVAPEAIAAKLAKKEAVDNDIAISLVAGVSYSSGRGPYDDEPHGWSTTKGVMVDTGGHRKNPKTVKADRETMETELRDKQLPAGEASVPVAGYLYFPAPEKRNAAVELEYRGAAGKTVLPLASAAK